jgi:MFS family permease
VLELLIAPMHDVRLVTAMLFLAGICFTVFSANANSTVQLEAPDALRGRVLSIYFYAWVGLTPVGSLIVGWLCDRGGTELAFVVLGLAGLAAVAASSWQLLQHRPVTLLGDPRARAEAR